MRDGGQPAEKPRGLARSRPEMFVPRFRRETRDDVRARGLLQQHDVRADRANHIAQIGLMTNTAVADVVAHDPQHSSRLGMSSTHGWSKVTSRMNWTSDVVAWRFTGRPASSHRSRR